MMQKFLCSDVDKGIKSYYTTDDNMIVKFEECADDGGSFIKLKTEGVYEIIIGYFYYKEAEELEEGDGICDIDFVPESEKIKLRDLIKSSKTTTYYKVSNYRISKHVLKGKNNSFRIPAGDSGVGWPLDVDILKLIRINKMSIDQITNKLKKYNISKSIIKQLLDHISYFEEHIDKNNIKEIGDRILLNISITYIFDNKKHDVDFDIDYSGNSVNWIWTDDYEYDDENDLQYILRNAVCKYLNSHYPYPL